MTGSIYKRVYVAAVFVTVLLFAALARAGVINPVASIQSGSSGRMLLESNEGAGGAEYLGLADTLGTSGVQVLSNGGPLSLTVTGAAETGGRVTDTETTPVPEPPTMLLLGAALVLGARMAGHLVTRR